MTDGFGVPARPASSRRRAIRGVATAFAALVAATAIGVAGSSPTSAVDDGDWLDVVNTYRAMSGLAPVTADATWSAQAHNHSCYMLENGITHDEEPGLPGYTPGGDIAGNSGNVAVSSSFTATPRDHIDLWMTSPFHAIGLLRPNLTRTGFGLCTRSETPTPWRSGATIDVIRGLDGTQGRGSPVVFPGDGATVPLDRFVSETPNPMTLCGWTGFAGLPLIAMMPNDVTNAGATLTGPGGPIETCVLHAGNVTNATARSILDGDDAVVVMPREILAVGAYTVAVDSDGGSATWSFTVDTSAPLAAEPATPAVLPDTVQLGRPVNFDPVDPYRLVDTRDGTGTTRLRGGKVVEIAAAEPDVVAISANFVAVAPDAPGHLTVFDCTSEVPDVSTLVYTPGRTVANQAIVPLRDGRFCLYSHTATDVVVDVNGYYRPGGADAEFNPIRPNRVYDSRVAADGRLRAGVERQIGITGGDGRTSGADAVALNVTAIGGSQQGHLQVYPCGSRTALETSTVNYGAAEARPNTVVVATGGTGKVCVRSFRAVDVAIDVTGYFSGGAGHEFTALRPIRMFDSRQPDRRLNGVTGGSRVDAGQVVRLQVAGERGVPVDAKAASVNLTVTGATQGLHVTAYPCGARPATSNLNAGPGQASANGAMVKLSDAGELCVYTMRDAHLIVDINGVWR